MLQRLEKTNRTGQSPSKKGRRPGAEDFHATFKIAWPLSLSYLGQMAIGITDVIMIGRLGPNQIAAGSLAIAVYLIVFLFALGIVLPATPLASQARGAKQPRQMRRVIRQGLWVAVTMAIPGYFVLWHIDDILLLLRQSPDLVALSAPYMHFFMWSLLPAIAYVALRCFLITLGHPTAAMLIMWGAVAVNIVLDYGLIFGNFGLPEMGMRGAGVASTIVNILMLLAMIAVTAFRKPFRRYRIFARIWRPDWQTYRNFFAMGWPISLQLLMEEGLFSAATMLMGLLGPREVAAHAIALNLTSISFMGSIGLADAAVARVGYAFGAKDGNGIHRAAYAALVLSLCIMVTSAIIFLAIPDRLAAVFIDPGTANAPQVILLAVSLITVAAVFQIFDGLQLVMSGILHGMSDMKVPTLIAVVTYWVFGMSVAVLFGFVFEWGAVGIWWGLATGLVLTALAFSLRFRYLTRNRI
ncbi:MATE family efflux transporter [Aestuariispira ectoiniformans]|uniref:MATE family efflux transporter n=1 Tax=Aestuariispira ectoiniformans TaxID=2775080 RepID=UPI00223B3C6A|nr:MATE family efflux transporter [Aestuariispira ectoiniformans]